MPTTKSSKPVSKSPAKSAKSTSKPAKSVRKTKGIGGAQPQAIQLPPNCTSDEMNQYVNTKIQEIVKTKIQEIVKTAQTDSAKNALKLMVNMDKVLNALMEHVQGIQNSVKEQINNMDSQIQANSPSTI